MTPKSPTELIADAYHAIRRLSVTDRTVALRATVLAALDDLHDAYVAEIIVVGGAHELDEPCPPTERNTEHATVLDQFDALKASLGNDPHPADMMQAARDFRDGEE